METEVVRALNLDANAQKNFIKFFKNLGEKPSSTVRLFDRNDYYSVHGEDDAKLLAKTVFKSLAQVKLMAPDRSAPGIPYITLSKGNFEIAVRELLLVLNYRVEVYSRPQGSSGNDWRIEYRGSPGNLIQFEDVLFSNQEIIIGTSIIAVQIRLDGSNERKLGLACVDQNDCLIQVTEFVDDEFFGELEATIVLLGPKECLLPSDEGDFSKIKILMERNGVTISIRKKNDFSLPRDDLIQDLNKLLRFEKGQAENANAVPEVSLETAMSSLGALIKYLDMTSDAANLGHYEIKQLNLKRFVHLDSAAVAALNVLPPNGTTPSTPSYHWQSILGVLDHCRTAQGHRLMAQWIKQPLRNEATLKDRHDVVECLLDSTTVLSELHDESLKRLPDIQMLMKKLLRKKASLQDLFKIFQVMLRTPRLVTTLLELENTSIKSCICDPLKSTLEDLTGLRQMVEQVLDFENIKNGEYLVKSSFDEDLAVVREKMDILKEKMELLIKKCADDLDLDKSALIRLEYVSHLGYHFRIALKDDKSLRNSSKYKILDAIRGGVRFTSEKLTKYDEEFQLLKNRYEEQQESIVNEVIRVALGYMGPLTVLNKSLAEIDCLVSFAIAAKTAPITYVRPKMLPAGSGVLELTNIRHPCLELQENVTYISNDVKFKKDETTMYLITGPNMGGKSTYIRSVGTTVLMAHVGAFVPCESALISMVDSILGRVGANDNIMKGLSTFMVEMIETSGIIRAATENSLVIIDELGRGTSTYEGCGIAWSIAEHLAKETRCFTLFSTHFHEITEMASYCKTVKNCHMAAVADNNNFLLLYQVRPGVMDKSFGIHVAKLADFPEKTIETAQKLYTEFDDQNLHLQTEKDKEFIKKLNDEILELSSKADELTEEDLKQVIAKFRDQAKTFDSDYFKVAYPSLE